MSTIKDRILSEYNSLPNPQISNAAKTFDDIAQPIPHNVLIHDNVAVVYGNNTSQYIEDLPKKGMSNGVTPLTTNLNRQFNEFFIKTLKCIHGFRAGAPHPFLSGCRLTCYLSDTGLTNPPIPAAAAYGGGGRGTHIVMKNYIGKPMSLGDWSLNKDSFHELTHCVMKTGNREFDECVASFCANEFLQILGMRPDYGPQVGGFGHYLGKPHVAIDAYSYNPGDATRFFAYGGWWPLQWFRAEYGIEAIACLFARMAVDNPNRKGFFAAMKDLLGISGAQIMAAFVTDTAKAVKNLTKTKVENNVITPVFANDIWQWKGMSVVDVTAYAGKTLTWSCLPEAEAAQFAVVTFAPNARTKLGAKGKLVVPAKGKTLIAFTCAEPANPAVGPSWKIVVS